MGAREGVAYPSLFLCAGDKIGKAFCLFSWLLSIPRPNGSQIKSLIQLRMLICSTCQLI